MLSSLDLALRGHRDADQSDQTNHAEDRTRDMPRIPTVAHRSPLAVDGATGGKERARRATHLLFLHPESVGRLHHDPEYGLDEHKGDESRQGRPKQRTAPRRED